MKVGEAVMYYLEGWRYGIVRRIPVRGERKGTVKIEVPVDRWKYIDGKWTGRARESNWVSVRNTKPV